MRFLSHRNYPEVERVASKDVSRPVLQHAFLRIVETGKGKSKQRVGTIEATDSFKLVTIPVELHDEDVEGFVTVEALKALKTAAKKHKYLDLHLLCTTEELLLESPSGRQTWQRPVNIGTFPDTPTLWPQEFSSFKIGLNAAFLADVAKAIGAKDAVVLEFTLATGKTEGEDTGFFPTNIRPFKVTASNSDGKAILMPVRVAA